MVKRALAVYGLILASGLAAVAARVAQDKEQLKVKLKDEVAGAWVYDDIAQGMAMARKANKPMMIVFR